MGKVLTWQSRQSGHTGEGELYAYWELDMDWITDDYFYEEASTEELFHKWLNIVRPRYPNGQIPILWMVRSKKGGIAEFMPFQYRAEPYPENFLTFFTWPVYKESGRKLNWLRMPVTDKLWTPRRTDKGGFIQTLTGWKPGIYQHQVHLDFLVQATEGQYFNVR